MRKLFIIILVAISLIISACLKDEENIGNVIGAESFSITSGQWKTIKFTVTEASTEIQITANKTVGSNYELFTMNSTNYMYIHSGSLNDSQLQIKTINNLSGSVGGLFETSWIPLPPGEYFIIIDNSKYGSIASQGTSSGNITIKSK